MSELEKQKKEQFDFFKGVDHFSQKETFVSFGKSIVGRIVLTAVFCSAVIYGLSLMGLKPTPYSEFHKSNYTQQVNEKTPAKNDISQPGEKNNDVKNNNTKNSVEK